MVEHHKLLDKPENEPDPHGLFYQRMKEIEYENVMGTNPMYEIAKHKPPKEQGLWDANDDYPFINVKHRGAREIRKALIELPEAKSIDTLRRIVNLGHTISATAQDESVRDFPERVKQDVVTAQPKGLLNRLFGKKEKVLVESIVKRKPPSQEELDNPPLFSDHYYEKISITDNPELFVGSWIDFLNRHHGDELTPRIVSLAVKRFKTLESENQLPDVIDTEN